MANDLRSFNYDMETNEGILPKKPNSISSGRASFKGSNPTSILSNEFVVLDSQNVPQNKLEIIERQMIKINRFLWDKFGSAENLTTHLKKFAEKDKNGNLSVTEFSEFLKDNLNEELQNRRI